MEISAKSTIEDIVEQLKEEHWVRYRNFNENQDVFLIKKDNAFGSLVFFVNDGKNLSYLKISPDLESRALTLQNIVQALSFLGITAHVK